MRGAMVLTHGNLQSVKGIDNWIIVSPRAQIRSGNDIRQNAGYSLVEMETLPMAITETHACVYIVHVCV